MPSKTYKSGNRAHSEADPDKIDDRSRKRPNVTLDDRFIDYPEDLRTAIETAHGRIPPSNPSEVFVLVHECKCTYNDTEFKVVSAFSQADKANIQALDLFQNEYALYIDNCDGDNFRNCSRQQDDSLLDRANISENEVGWKINEHGCLMLVALDGGDGDWYKVYVKRLKIDDDFQLVSQSRASNRRESGNRSSTTSINRFMYGAC